MFITFEGLDGSGKSTHLRRVADELSRQGIAHVLTHEPGGTALGEAVRSVFLDPHWGSMDGTVELLLVFASRRQHLIEVIEPALAAGQHVLCDRFTDSTIAYQGYGRGVALATIQAVDRLATGACRPDRTLLFDLSPEEAQRRGQSYARRRRGSGPGGIDRLDAEGVGFYRRVRNGYLEIARGDAERVRIIDSTHRREATEAYVDEALSDLLARSSV